MQLNIKLQISQLQKNNKEMRTFIITSIIIIFLLLIFGTQQKVSDFNHNLNSKKNNVNLDCLPINKISNKEAKESMDTLFYCIFRNKRICVENGISVKQMKKYIPTLNDSYGFSERNLSLFSINEHEIIKIGCAIADKKGSKWGWLLASFKDGLFCDSKFILFQNFAEKGHLMQKIENVDETIEISYRPSNQEKTKVKVHLIEPIKIEKWAVDEKGKFKIVCE
ncbi:MAG: hypothetical protein EAY69_05555 [Cytophagales bacterium]|nr:MAG: hypothetical protein EAY69_05555 [Cytophagales bacterium]